MLKYDYAYLEKEYGVTINNPREDKIPTTCSECSVEYTVSAMNVLKNLNKNGRHICNRCATLIGLRNRYLKFLSGFTIVGSIPDKQTEPITILCPNCSMENTLRLVALLRRRNEPDFGWCRKCIQNSPRVMKALSEANMGRAGRAIPDAEREIISAKMKKRWEDPEYRRKKMDQIHGQWSDPEFKERHLLASLAVQDIREETLAIIKADPENRKKQAAISKELWQNPEYRKKAAQRVITRRNLEPEVVSSRYSKFKFLSNRSMSDLEQKIALFLGTYSIPFTHNYTIDHSYDFFVPSLNLLVEVDGMAWHNHEFCVDADSTDRQKRTSEKKEAVARKHGYRFLILDDIDLLSPSKFHEEFGAPTIDQSSTIVSSINKPTFRHWVETFHLSHGGDSKSTCFAEYNDSGVVVAAYEFVKLSGREWRLKRARSLSGHFNLDEVLFHLSRLHAVDSIVYQDPHCQDLTDCGFAAGEATPVEYYLNGGHLVDVHSLHRVARKLCVPDESLVEFKQLRQTQRDLIEWKKDINIPYGHTSSISHQKAIKLRTIEEDAATFENLFNRHIDEYTLQTEPWSPEVGAFIQKYEWLGTAGPQPKWVFSARIDDVLACVIAINTPYARSKYLGAETGEIECLIQRGASASFCHEHMGSKLIRWAARWMVENTNKRVFFGYADSTSGEVGTIYQACGFEFMGWEFGARMRYTHPAFKNGKLFSTQELKRTSTLKKWYRDTYGLALPSEWIKANRFKDINAIPSDIWESFKAWGKSIIEESEARPESRKGKYILVLGKDKREQSRLDSLKAYTARPYPKRGQPPT